MRQKILFLLIVMTLLSACSTGQVPAAPLALDTPVPSKPTITPVTAEGTDLPASPTATLAPVAPPEQK
ncbi:MAG: hypothetical protein ACM3Y8_11815 [Byssovorax cruenta]